MNIRIPIHYEYTIRFKNQDFTNSYKRVFAIAINTYTFPSTHNGILLAGFTVSSTILLIGIIVNNGILFIWFTSIFATRV